MDNSVIPYSEDANAIIESIINQLSALASKIKKDDKSTIIPKKNNNQVAVHILNTKRWAYGTLQGLNSSKVSVSIDDKEFIRDIVERGASDNILMYLQGLNVRVYADLVYCEDNSLVFRYRKMTKDDAQRLAYFINYCQKNPEIEKVVMNV